MKTTEVMEMAYAINVFLSEKFPKSDIMSLSAACKTTGSLYDNVMQAESVKIAMVKSLSNVNGSE